MWSIPRSLTTWSELDDWLNFIYVSLTAMDRSHPYVKRVVDTAQRIVRANRDIEQFNGIEWRVSIFDEPGLLNAMVNADGQIIVFKGKIVLPHVPEKMFPSFIYKRRYYRTMCNRWRACCYFIPWNGTCDSESCGWEIVENLASRWVRLFCRRFPQLIYYNVIVYRDQVSSLHPCYF